MIGKARSNWPAVAMLEARMMHGADRRARTDGSQGPATAASDQTRPRPVRRDAGPAGLARRSRAVTRAAGSAVLPARPRPPVAMSRPISFLSAVRPSRIADELAAVHHRDPVGQLEDLVELGRDEQDRRAGVALWRSPGDG